MKFITRPEISVEQIEMPIYSALGILSDINPFNIFKSDEELAQSKDKYKSHTVTYNGRSTISSFKIQCDEELEVGTKISIIEIDDLILNGVIPICKEDDIYECVVDYIKIVENRI